MTNDTAQPITTNSIAEIVANDLCIGCGLCEALTGGRVTMVMTPAGSLRPSSTDAFTNREEAQLMAACPGAVAEARTEDGTTTDPVWGAHRWMSYAWADQPDTRFRAATGGALTALGAHALNTGRAEFVLHVGADPERPMRSRWVLSEDADSVRANTSSRYGPTAPLAGLAAALERRRPFAIIAKPCDLGAVHTLSKSDPRVDELCVIRLALVCGGQSRLSKSQAVLHELGVDESEVTLFRYRGHGNPGPTVIETAAGDRYAKTYLDMWEDESGWEVETRCKLCPDALGEASDVAAADVWPGGCTDRRGRGVQRHHRPHRRRRGLGGLGGRIQRPRPRRPHHAPPIRQPPTAPGTQEGSPGRPLPRTVRRRHLPHRDPRPADCRTRPPDGPRTVRTTALGRTTTDRSGTIPSAPRLTCHPTEVEPPAPWRGAIYIVLVPY